MKKNYLDTAMKVVEQAPSKLAVTHRLDFKNVFGAVGCYVDGRIFISCGKFGVALRLPPEILDALFEERGVRHLNPHFPDDSLSCAALTPIQI